MRSPFRRSAAPAVSAVLLLAGGSATAPAQTAREVHVRARWLEAAVHQSGELVAITADSLVFSQDGKEVRRAANAVDRVEVREAADRWHGARVGAAVGAIPGLVIGGLAAVAHGALGCETVVGHSCSDPEGSVAIGVAGVTSFALIGAGIGALVAHAHWIPLGAWLRHNNITIGVRSGN